MRVVVSVACQYYLLQAVSYEKIGRWADEQRIDRKLHQMTQWPKGWGYGGERITQKSTDAARKYVEQFLDLHVAVDVFPDLDGGCTVAAYRGDCKLVVSISKSGSPQTGQVEVGIGSDYTVLKKVRLKKATAAKKIDELMSLLPSTVGAPMAPEYFPAHNPATVSEIGTYNPRLLISAAPVAHDLVRRAGSSFVPHANQSDFGRGIKAIGV